MPESTFNLIYQLIKSKSAHRHHLLCRLACTSQTFCSLIACSWLDLAVCDTQGPVVSKKSIELTRSKSQISPEWAERHKCSPTDCCPRHASLLSTWTMHIAITDCSVRAKVCFGGRPLGTKASHFCQDIDGVRDQDVISRLWFDVIFHAGNNSCLKHRHSQGQFNINHVEIQSI